MICPGFLFLALLAVAVPAVVAPAASAAEMPPINVWPGLAPGETTSNPGRVADRNGGVTRLTDITEPQLLLFKVEGTKRPAVMVCPGGGYSILADDLEGTEVAKWLNTLGITAAVLHYRVPGKREGAFQDAERSLSLLRSRADEYGIDPGCIGVLGFSAGGHLSARLAASFGKRAYEPIDAVDAVSCRPDFAVLIYPAYLVEKGQIAPEVQPHHDTPPEFLTQTEDDPFFCVPEYARALAAVHVEAKAVTYTVGGHGYGLRAPASHPVHEWPLEAGAWLKKQIARLQPAP